MGFEIFDKYTWAVRFLKAKNYKTTLPKCKTLQAWDADNKFKFGFIPLGDLVLPKKCEAITSTLNPIELHKQIKRSCKPNFPGEQILLKSQLNANKWDSLLQGYWDTQLPLLIRHGFPLDSDRNSVLKAHNENHESAKDCPDDVQAYLNEEREYAAILGPFAEPPIEKPTRLPIHD